MAEELLVHAEGEAFIADTGDDADRIRANIKTATRYLAVLHVASMLLWLR